jgi:hypothetical protein
MEANNTCLQQIPWRQILESKNNKPITLLSKKLNWFSDTLYDYRIIPSVPSILALVPPPPNEPQDGPSTVQEDTTDADGDSVVELPNF